LIGRNLHGGVGVSDGFVEPAELRGHIGEPGSRERRLDAGSAKALVAKVTLERGVPLQQWNCVAELAPGDVRHAQQGHGKHLDRAIAEGAREAQGLLSESEGPVVVARGPALAHHESRDPCEPVRVAERPGEALRLVEVLPHARPLAERDERVPQVDAEVDGQLRRLPPFGETAEGPEASRFAPCPMARSPVWRE
jgi:hypothetical protein